MDKIDLDAIINKVDPEGNLWLNDADWARVRQLMKEAIHQFAVLASEKAKVDLQYDGLNDDPIVDKQSILDVEKLIK